MNRFGMAAIVPGYIEVPAAKAWKLINHGPLGFVCTADAAGGNDFAPVAWIANIDYEPTSRLMVVLDPACRSAANLRADGRFAVAVPHASQRALALAAGGISGAAGDKYAALGAPSFPAALVPCRVPVGVVAWIELGLDKAIDEGSVVLFIASARYAACVDAAWNGDRLLAETPAGRTLHHLGGEAFAVPASILAE